MARTRLNTEETFKSILGNMEINQEESKIDASIQEIAEPRPLNPIKKNPINKKKVQPTPPEEETKEEAKEESKKRVKEKLIQTAFYITKKQHTALKIRAALGNNPVEKDQSAIIRAALDVYLAETLKTL